MNLQLYAPATAAIVALQKRLRKINPNARRRTKAQLVAWSIDEGLTEYHTSDKILPPIRAGKTVWVRVALDDATINAVHALPKVVNYENTYNALALIGAERILQNLKTKTT